MADHYMISDIRKLNANFQAKRNQIDMEFRSMQNHDREGFLFSLQGVDWEMAASTATSDPNIMANNFCDLLHSVLNVHAPLKTQREIMKHAPSPGFLPVSRN